MGDHYAVVIEGLTDLDVINGIPDKIAKNASRAVNAAARRAYAEAGRRITREINFPAGYVTGANGRLQITKFANPGKLEATITGRRRPTSLARFARSAPKSGGARSDGLTVEVTRGAAVRLKRAFFVRLRSGANSVDTKSNLGIAIRLKPGQRPRQVKEGAKQLAPGLWLLYAVSVQQAFINKSGGGAAEEVSPDTADFLEREFMRLMEVDL